MRQVTASSLFRLVASVALLLAATVSPFAQPAPDAIRKLYDELRIAAEMRDLDAMMARFAPLMRLAASLGEQGFRERAAMVQEHENLAVELTLDEVKVVDDRAFVLSTWAATGTTIATGEPWNATVRMADILFRRGDGWEIIASSLLSQEGLAGITDSTYRDPKTGLEATAPTGWRLLPATGGRATVLAVSPDLSVAITWAVTDVPGTFALEELVRASEDAFEKLGPTIGLKSRDLTMGPSTLAGRPAYHSYRVIMAEGMPDLAVDATQAAIGPTVYSVSAHAFPAAAYATHEAAIARTVAATVIAPPQAAELPPEAGRVEGGKYINDVHGCEITAPEGWETTVEQGDFKLQVSMREPGGTGAISLGMIALPQPGVTAEQAVLGDDGVSQQAFEAFELVRRGETMIGDLPAYESVTQFDFGGQPRERWRVYLVDGDRLFFMFADATPADGWDNLEKLFRAAFDSLKLR